jgi:hypothetical protein
MDFIGGFHIISKIYSPIIPTDQAGLVVAFFPTHFVSQERNFMLRDQAFAFGQETTVGKSRQHLSSKPYSLTNLLLSTH